MPPIESVSRTKYAAKNTFFSASAFLLKLIINFVARGIFIRFFGIEYGGLNNLFANILGLLSLAELGIGSAIVYSLYKPVAENDTEKIKTLVGLYKKIYLIIGTVILVIGLSLIPLLPHLIASETSVEVNLPLVYSIFLLNTVIGYFFAHRRTLIFVYQRNDIESKMNIAQVLLLNLTQVLIIIFLKNYLIYIAVMPVFTLIESILIYYISYRMFPKIRGKAEKLDVATKKEITKNTSALVFHQIGGAIVNSTDGVIISLFLGLTTLGIYSNYALIVTTLVTFFGLVANAFKSGIGNQIAVSDIGKAYNIFNSLNFLFFWGAGFSTACVLALSQDFIRIWVGDDYLLSFYIVILICVNFYLRASRELVNAYKNGAGLFWNDRFKPLFEAGINLGLDFLLVINLGLTGVILATIISTVTVSLWVEPYVLFKNYFKKPFKNYIVRYLAYSGVVCVAISVTLGICYLIPSVGIFWFILKCAICLVVPNLIFLLCFFKTPEFRYLWGVLIGFVKTKTRKGNKRPVA
jgi:O-antigen/teichoic acid export membrane protein